MFCFTAELTDSSELLRSRWLSQRIFLSNIHFLRNCGLDSVHISARYCMTFTVLKVAAFKALSSEGCKWLNIILWYGNVCFLHSGGQAQKSKTQRCSVSSCMIYTWHAFSDSFNRNNNIRMIQECQLHKGGVVIQVCLGLDLNSSRLLMKEADRNVRLRTMYSQRK